MAKKQNGARKVRIEFKRFSEVAPHPDNPRTISDDALTGLGASIDRFGYVEPIVVNEATGHVVGGHQRLKAMQAKGDKGADMVMVNLTAEQERALLITLNNPHIQGTWTPDLQRVLDQVHEMVDIDYDALGLAALEESAHALFASMKEPEEPKPPHTVEVGEDRYMVLITCEDERACKSLYDEMQGRGFECKVIT